MNKAEYIRYVKFAEGARKYMALLNAHNPSEVLMDAGVYSLVLDRFLMEENVWIPKPVKWVDIEKL